MHYYIYILIILLWGTPLHAQDSSQVNELRQGEYYGTIEIDGQVLKVLIIDGDTLPIADFDQIQFTQKRNFRNKMERKRYHQWRRYAAKVYPYAAEAVKIFREAEEETKGMKRRQRKRYTRNLERDLKPEYEAELKKLTKSQGYILIKMVERELNRPFYDVIRSSRGKLAAFKWQTLGKFYGYNLKKGYDPKDDPLLEIILNDLDIRYGDN